MEQGVDAGVEVVLMLVGWRPRGLKAVMKIGIDCFSAQNVFWRSAGQARLI